MEIEAALNKGIRAGSTVKPVKKKSEVEKRKDKLKEKRIETAETAVR